MKNLSEKCIKTGRTVVLYFSFFALGLCTAIPGPTLLDLKQIVKANTSQLGYIYLSRSGGYLFGSLLGGIIFDIVRRKQLALLFCNLLMALTTFATPWCKNLEFLLGVSAVAGLAMGALDIGGNVLCLNLWGKESAPYFQALHFLFGLGAFLAPIIAEPFLSEECIQNATSPLLELSQNSNDSHYSFGLRNLSYVNGSNSSCLSNTFPPVIYSYAIIACFSLFVTFLFLILAIVCPWDLKRTANHCVKRIPENSVFFTVGIALLTQVVLSLYCGIEIGYGQLLVAYSVKGELKLSKSVGSFITAFYWGTFTFARGVSIFLSHKYPAYKLIFGDLIFIKLGLFFLATFGRTYIESFWVGTFLLAMGLASFYPSVISLVDSFIHVNNKIASLFVISGCLGEMVLPITASQFMESYPVAMIYIFIGCDFVMTIGVVIIMSISRKTGERYATNANQNFHGEHETTM